jgi:hypothetical protein
MKKIIFSLCIFFSGLMACKDKKKEAETPTVVEPKTESSVSDPAKDSTEIRKVITEFYNWYTRNDTKFQEYDLYSGIKKKDEPPYKINWEEVTKYQDFIRTSVPQLSEEFFTNQKKMLQQCDSAFKVDVTDELPYGFDYDWYTNSQEDPQYLLDEINKNKPWPINIEGSTAFVEVKGEFENNGKKELSTFVSLYMKKENGQWKIAKIGLD